MKLVVDQDLCISCGLCITACSEVFDWNEDGKASAITADVPQGLVGDCQLAVEGCPTEAISEI